MPRPPRIEYPNAFYHVMNRGRNKDNIFNDDLDFRSFLDIIRQAARKFNLVVHSYCIMNNHYHLLLETPDANLSQIMHFVSNEYVKKYNKRMGFDGPLFKSRYKAILVDKDSYLIHLTRYIHRNAIVIKKNFRDYRWSSYPAYLNISKTPFWLNKKATLGILNFKNDLNKYAKFVESPQSKEIYGERKNIPSILGGSDFKKRILSIKK